jgi:hypothetical protein
MNIKQTMKVGIVAGLFATALSLTLSPTTFAVTKAQFKDAVCSLVQGPGAGDTCRKEIEKNGSYKLGSSGKTIKLSDWKDASKADVTRAVQLGATTPAELTEAEKKQEDKAESDGADNKDGCAGAETAIIKCDADNSGGVETNGVWFLLLMVINILTAGIGIAAVGGIVYGSILYVASGADESRVKKAKEIIQNVVIGLIAYVAMYALLQFIIPGGIFS